LSHRHGNRVLPTRVLAEEFNILKKEINENIEIYKEDLAFKNEEKNLDYANLLEISYMLDENEVPHRYRLLPISKIIPGYNSEVNGLSLPKIV